MRSARLDELACQHGIGLTRPSPANTEVPITNKTKRKMLAALGVDLRRKDFAEEGKKRPAKRSARKPIPKSYLPDFLSNTRVWGISLQLYELRSARNWGIGDFQDLLAIVDLARSLGADFIGLNPLHAPFLADPDRCSPYEPSNRQMLNSLYIAVDKVPGFESDPEIESRVHKLRQTNLVDYVGIAQTKLSVLRKLWQARERSPEGDRLHDQDAFDEFVKQGGRELRLHALFEAVSAFMGKQGRGAGWRSWPPEYQDVDHPSITSFARGHVDEIRFFMWLQWLAHCQLTKAADAARSAGLRIGLYLDLAVGEAIDGSATWSERDAYISQVTVGSPPDPFATDGQDWHLAAFNPNAIAKGKKAPYRRMVTAAMRYAGAIRIDHAAALKRLFLVPLNSRPDAGAYVDYPEADLLRILAEASAQYRCLVIGEDLGVLPEGLQEDLAKARILSYRILSYERDVDSFKPPEVYPVIALACISTHDHHSLAGWWRAADIKARAQHGIIPPDVTNRHVEARKDERNDLKAALEEAGVEPPARLPPRSAGEDKLRELEVSAHRFIAKTPSMLAAVRLADITAERRPTNIPGTTDSYPNWKPKLSIPIEEIPKLPFLRSIAKVMHKERPNLSTRRRTATK